MFFWSFGILGGFLGLYAIPPIARYFLSHRSNPRRGCDTPPPWCLLLHRHISAIPHFATYRAILVRYPRKTSTKTFCDTIAQSIARYEKYRYWASQVGQGEVQMYPTECGEQLGTDPSKIGSSKSLVLKSFSGEGTLWDSSLPVSLTLWDTPALFTPPLPLRQKCLF